MIKNRILLVLLLVAFSAAAQQKLTTSIDSTRHKIGAEFRLTLKADVDTLSKVTFPKMKMAGALEVIRSYPIDTIRNKDRYALVKKYGLTQFDSGKFTIPQIPVMISGKPVLSDSIRVQVANVAVDTLKQKMYDIKDVTPASGGIGDWWIYLLIPLVIGAIGYFAYRFIKNRQIKKQEESAFKTPIEKATLLLNTLEKKELVQRGEIKAYYSELTDIARNYIEEAIHIPAMESTTSELIAALRIASVKKKMSLSQETVENLERVLKQADLVKFAKSKPLDYEIADDRSKIERSIVTLDKSIPEEAEDDEMTLLQRQLAHEMLIKKQRRNRILITSGIVAFLIMFAVGTIAATKGVAFLKDNILGHPTKELLQGEWVYSAYGDPGVRIETPKVLVRQDVSKMLPKETMALIKDMTMFAYGSLTDHFYVLVATTKFAKETEMDLNKAVEGALQTMQQQGAQNIVVKQEEFNTGKGITGNRAYGTMTMVDQLRGKSVKVYYEMLMFKQEGGLQEVMVAHEEGDTYGQDILTRIVNSVELQAPAQ